VTLPHSRSRGDDNLTMPRHWVGRRASESADPRLLIRSSPFLVWGDPPFPTSFDAAHEARSRSHCNTLMATSGRGDRGGHVATGQTASWDSHVQLGTVSTADRSLQLNPVPTPTSVYGSW
jgi:hypothetical protein